MGAIDAANALQGAQPAASGPSEAGARMRDEISELIPLMRDSASEAESLGALTPKTVEALSATGVFAISTPVELGGSSLGARDTAEVMVALGRGDGSAGWVASGAVGNYVLVLAFPEPAHEEVFSMLDGWIGPLVVGASLFATKVGEGRRVDGGWMVKGKWPFGSGCAHAGWAIVGIEYEEDGKPQRGQVLLERDQYAIRDDWKVMGLEATSSNSLVAEEEVFVPVHRFVSMTDFPIRMEGLRGRYEGAGFAFGAQARVQVVGLANAALALGMAKGALDCFAEQAPARKPFNLPYDSVAEMASAQVTAGTVRAMINVAEAAISRCADEIDAISAADQDFEMPTAMERSMDLILATRLCAEAIDEIQICLGSSTVARKNPIQRFVRDVRVLCTHGAMRFDPMAEINGRDVLGLPPFPMFAGGLPER